MEISEKEFAVIREISNNHLPDQRTIANRTGISLGLTNLIIKKLINKGHIKAKQLDRNKIQYILTPKGFAEKAKKSYNFTLRTISLFKSIREKLHVLILQELKKGADRFEIAGDNEIAEIVELAFGNIAKGSVTCTRVKPLPGNEHTIVLGVASSRTNSKCTVDIIEYLSEEGLFSQGAKQ